MSSLAAVQADGYYLPPEWDPKMGDKNKFNKSHPLGVRAKKINQGIIVIRFEMPYKVQCTGCEVYIGKGTRFNAEKKKCGMYYTTTLWEVMVIQTDPKNRDYAFVSGIRKKDESFDPIENATLVTATDDAERNARLLDPLLALEHAEGDRSRGKHALPQMMQLQLVKEDLYKDDFTANQAARAVNRKKRKLEEAALAEGKAFGLDLPVLPAVEEDIETAKEIPFKKENSFSIGQKKRRLIAVGTGLFGAPTQAEKSKVKALSKVLDKGINIRNIRVTSGASRAVYPDKRTQKPNFTLKRKPEARAAAGTGSLLESWYDHKETDEEE